MAWLVLGNSMPVETSAPTAPRYVIVDNLSAHKGEQIRRWANPIKAHFGPLRQFTVASSNHSNHTVQTRALHAYLRWRNTSARHPDVLTAQRCAHARVRSEKGIRWGGRLLPGAA